MRIITADQNSAEWIQARVGRLTASRMNEVMNVLKRGSGESAKRFNYKWEVVIERITGFANQHYVSPDMEYGTSGESPARREYELRIDKDVDRTGFVLHPEYDFVGASPDLLVDNDGMGEIKVPRLATHLKWFADGIVPEMYVEQCMTGMNCCEREYCDFISYSPPDPDDPQRLNLPKELQMFIKRLYRDDTMIHRMDAEAERFNHEANEIIERLAGKRPVIKLPILLKDALKASVQEVDAEMGITDDDLPDWYRNMKEST